MQPYTAPTLKQLGEAGTERIDIICPGFSADCLETLEEIAMEGKDDFITAGGKAYHYIPALNEDEAWIKALTDLVERHLSGWPTKQAEDPHALEATARNAIRLGAHS